MWLTDTQNYPSEAAQLHQSTIFFSVTQLLSQRERERERRTHTHTHAHKTHWVREALGQGERKNLVRVMREE